MRKGILNKIPEDMRNVMTLMVGNGVALSLPVFLSPILSRIYEIDDFGQYTVFTAMIALISSFASGRYEYSILVSKSRNSARQLYKLAVMLLSITAFMSLIVIISFNDPIISLLNVEGLGWLIFLVPVNIFLFTLIRISHNGLNREKAYKPISFSKSSRAAVVGVMQLGLGFTGWVAGGLIIGKFVGDFFTAGYLSAKLNTSGNYIRSKISSRRMKHLAVKYKRFPQINTIHAFLNASSNNAIPLIIGALFSQEIVGLFGLSFMVCLAPVQLIGTAVYQVYSRNVSVLFNQGDSTRSYTMRTLKTLSGIAVIPFLILLLFGPDLFSLVFGAKWVASGEYAQILAPYLFIGFLLTPLTYLPLIYNEHKKALYFEVLSTSFKILSLIIGSYMGSIYSALILFSVSGILVHAATLMWITRLSGNTLNS